MNLKILKDGTVMKDGAVLGTILKGVMTPRVPLSNAVKGAVRRTARNARLRFAVPEAVAAEDATGGDDTHAVRPDVPGWEAALSDAQLLDLVRRRGLAAQAAEAGARAVNVPDRKAAARPALPGRRSLPVMLERVARGEIPPPPPTGPEGDRTPAFVEWFRHYGTAEQFEAQYGGRQIGETGAPAGTRTWLRNELADDGE
ncbi:hypothetical protein WJU23_14510 [Prosthecobacter sp. SYSU 5D2]|uniref:hypothetical protein n=1 Tax=Prosthecobacter sp. SYSU 5D2 TaxID=3134134 RepID=UPI0031FEFA93